MRFIAFASLLGYITISILQAQFLDARTICRTIEDGSDEEIHQDVSMWSKQRASLIIKWLFIFESPASQSNVTAYLDSYIPILNNLFNRTIESAIPFKIITTNKQQLSNSSTIITLDTNITLYDESHVASNLLMSQKLGSSLLKLFDCSMNCMKLTPRGPVGYRSYYQVHIKDKLRYVTRSKSSARSEATLEAKMNH
jgi:hypothetical protein